jgi:uncharacterized protein YrrD
MKRFANDLIGCELVAFQEKATAGKIDDVIIDPNTGAVLGFGFKFQRERKVIPINEVRTFGPDFVIINSAESISEPEDVIRISEALALEAPIIGEKVETESGQKLGEVSDYTIELSKMGLDKLYVRPSMGLNFLVTDLIISAKNIIEIQKKKIIVTDSYARSKKSALGIIPTPAID